MCGCGVMCWGCVGFCVGIFILYIYIYIYIYIWTSCLTACNCNCDASNRIVDWIIIIESHRETSEDLHHK